jgi:iron complex transport system substrate-binding protein
VFWKVLHSLWIVFLAAWFVPLQAAPQRVVSLLPSLTETVCALGACGRLVGVDRYSNWPDSVRHLPTVGGGIDPNIEAIVALKPDLVLIAESSRAIEKLSALGLKVLVLEPKTHEQVGLMILKVADALGLSPEIAQKAWQSVNMAVSEAASALPKNGRNIRVYFEVSRTLYAAGESSFIGQTLKRLGVANVVPAELGPFPKLNPEFVVRAKPDLIMMGQSSLQDMATRPGWNRLLAVREQRVCSFSSSEQDAIVRAGPRMAEGAHLLKQCILQYLENKSVQGVKP